MTIGEKIKARRLQIGWSQRKLSDAMGYSNHSTITRIESGQVDIPQSRIQQFADVLGVSVPYLMGWQEQPEDPLVISPEDRQLIRLLTYYRQLSDRDQQLVQTMVETLIGRDDAV